MRLREEYTETTVPKLADLLNRTRAGRDSRKQGREGRADLNVVIHTK